MVLPFSETRIIIVRALTCGVEHKKRIGKTTARTEEDAEAGELNCPIELVRNRSRCCCTVPSALRVDRAQDELPVNRWSERSGPSEAVLAEPS